MSSKIDNLIILDSEHSKALKERQDVFRADWKADEKWRKKRRLWNEFYHGRQWSQEELQELKDRGQPATVRNRIKPKVDAMVGVELALKVNIKAISRGQDDQQTAEVISEVLRLIEDDNDFDTLEAKAFSSTLKMGRAWYLNETIWENNEAFSKTSLIPCEDIVPDKNGRKDDLSDYSQIHHTFMMDEKDAKLMWPEYADLISQSFLSATPLPNDSKSDTYPHTNISGDQYNYPNQTDNLFTDPKSRRVRIVRTYYRTFELRKYIAHPELGVEDITNAKKSDVEHYKKMFGGAQIYTDRKTMLNFDTFCASCILESEKDVRPFDKDAKYPLVLVAGWFDEDEHIHVGIIEQFVDAQKEVNKRGSKMLHLLNTNQIEMEEGAVEDINMIRSEAAKPDGVIVRRKGFAFARDKNLDVAQSQFQLLQEAKGEIDAAGAANELLGQSQASSGRDFQLRQQAAIQPIRELFLNLRGSRRRVASLWLDDIQQFWTSERFVKVTDDPEDMGVVLNQVVIDPITGQTTVRNDVSIGRYDVKIEEAQDSPNLQSEIFDSLIALAKTGVPVPPQLLIESSPLPKKHKLLGAIEKQQRDLLAAQQQGQQPQPGTQPPRQSAG